MLSEPICFEGDIMFLALSLKNVMNFFEVEHSNMQPIPNDFEFCCTVDKVIR